MSPAPRPGPRLVVALPPDEASLALLDSAMALADRLERELLGLFLEDQGLLAAAGLPFTRIVPRRAASEAAFDLASTERAVRVLAERARARLAGSAAAQRVRWRFEVVRGGLGAVALEAGDVLALGLAGALLAEPGPAPPPCPVVVMGRRGGPVVVVHEGSPATLALAERLAGDGGVPLVVLAASEDLLAAARERLAGRARVETCPVADERPLEAALRALRPGFVVVDSGGGAATWRAAIEAVRPGAEPPDEPGPAADRNGT